MEYINKKTTELTPLELEKIAALFECVMGKERSVEAFRNQYINNVFGTSYHVLMYEGEELVGHIAGVPGYFYLDGKKVVTLNNVDLMIHKDHRGLRPFWALVDTAWTFYKEMGAQTIYSLPNNNSHPFLVKLEYVQEVAQLYTFCLPYRIGGVKKALWLLNPLSKIFCYGWAFFTGLFASRKPVEYKVQRDYESFSPTRWKRADGQYSFGELKKNRFVYKITEYEGIRTAFILDIEKKSQKAFCDVVKYLMWREGKKFDLILYVGYLPFTNPGMVRVPHNYEPKNFNFVASILNDEGITEEDKKIYLDINNWDINLSDDDII